MNYTFSTIVTSCKTDLEITSVDIADLRLKPRMSVITFLIQVRMRYRDYFSPSSNDFRACIFYINAQHIIQWYLVIWCKLANPKERQVFKMHELPHKSKHGFKHSLSPWHPQTATFCWAMPRAIAATPLFTVQMASVSSRASCGQRSCKRTAAAASCTGQRPVSM